LFSSSIVEEQMNAVLNAEYRNSLNSAGGISAISEASTIVNVFHSQDSAKGTAEEAMPDSELEPASASHAGAAIEVPAPETLACIALVAITIEGWNGPVLKDNEVIQAKVAQAVEKAVASWVGIPQGCVNAQLEIGLKASARAALFCPRQFISSSAALQSHFDGRRDELWSILQIEFSALAEGVSRGAGLQFTWSHGYVGRSPQKTASEISDGNSSAPSERVFVEDLHEEWRSVLNGTSNSTVGSAASCASFGAEGHISAYVGTVLREFAYERTRLESTSAASSYNSVDAALVRVAANATGAAVLGQAYAGSGASVLSTEGSSAGVIAAAAATAIMGTPEAQPECRIGRPDVPSADALRNADVGGVVESAIGAAAAGSASSLESVSSLAPGVNEGCLDGHVSSSAGAVAVLAPALRDFDASAGRPQDKLGCIAIVSFTLEKWNESWLKANEGLWAEVTAALRTGVALWVGVPEACADVQLDVGLKVSARIVVLCPKEHVASSESLQLHLEDRPRIC
jgi:hypothetical protein